MKWRRFSPYRLMGEVPPRKQNEIIFATLVILLFLTAMYILSFYY